MIGPYLNSRLLNKEIVPYLNSPLLKEIVPHLNSLLLNKEIVPHPNSLFLSKMTGPQSSSQTFRNSKEADLTTSTATQPSAKVVTPTPFITKNRVVMKDAQNV